MPTQERRASVVTAAELSCALNRARRTLSTQQSIGKEKKGKERKGKRNDSVERNRTEWNEWKQVGMNQCQLVLYNARKGGNEHIFTALYRK